LGDMDDFLSKYPVGVSISTQSKSLKESALRLSEILSNRDTPQICRSVAERYFSLDAGVENYTNLYSRMSKQEN
jgi:hypothetical protein